MADDFTQANRRLRIETPLGPDALLITALSGTEGVSSLFRFEAELLGRDENADFDSIVGANVTVSIGAGGGPRFINGIVSRFSQSGTVGDHPYYRAEIVPWLWFLTRTSDCRIFQRKSVPDILKQLFGEYGFSDFRFKLSGSYEPREYCVQYRETDYNFTARLLEEEGICFFFDHEDGKHPLVLADHPSAHVPCPVLSSVRFMQQQTATTEEEDVVTWFTKEQEIRTGQWSATDYNFEQPALDLSSTATGQDDRSYEVYDHPTGSMTRAANDQLVRIRQQEEDATRILCRGSGSARSFTPGFQFSMRAQGSRVSQSFDGRYLLTAVEHSASEGYGTTGGTSAVSYANQFECVTASVPYRPRRRTHAPVIVGVQTATVVGPAGEEIFTDKYGRVKVQFHWDREGKRDENSSCWLRISHPWAGKGWGFVSIPRIGQEVVVQFLEGSPDQPMIVGSVYNGENMPFYKLPDFKTLAYVKSNTSTGGNGFNELRFEDKKDKEQVFIHSQRRMDVRVKRSMYETIGGARNTGIGGEYALTVGGSHDLHVKGDIYVRGDGKIDASTGGPVNLKVGAASKHYATGAKEINARAVTIEGMTSIVLKVSSSFIEISPMGVTIQGPMVRINSGGAAAGTTGIDYDDPLDAEGADTGEPGYLERPRRGGGGGRKHHHWDGYHARPTTYNPATNTWNYGGSGIAVTGTPDFADKTLQTLASLDATPTGHQLIDNLQSNGHTATIREATPAEAAANGGGLTTGVQPAMSNGTGSDSTVAWAPGNNAQFTDENGVAHTQPDEALLGHELNHADHNGRGASLNGTPDPADPTGNQEESRTIGINDHKDEPVSENNILRDMGENWRRTDHDSKAHTAP